MARMRLSKSPAQYQGPSTTRSGDPCGLAHVGGAFWGLAPIPCSQLERLRGATGGTLGTPPEAVFWKVLYFRSWELWWGGASDFKLLDLA